MEQSEKKVIKVGIPQLKNATPKIVSFISEIVVDVCAALATVSAVMDSKFWTITLIILGVVFTKAKKFFGEVSIDNTYEELNDSVKV